MSRPQSQLSSYSERYRSIPTPRTPSSSRRLTFGRPRSRQSEDIDDEGDITITLETANVTPRRRHNATMSQPARPESRMSIRSVSQDDNDVFKRPESAAGRRQSGIPTPADRRTSGIPAPRRQSGIPARPASPTRSTSSSSFHSDTQHSVVSPSTSAGSMGAPASLLHTFRRQSGAQSALPAPKSGLPIAGRKSGIGSAIPLPK